MIAELAVLSTLAASAVGLYQAVGKCSAELTGDPDRSTRGSAPLVHLDARDSSGKPLGRFAVSGPATVGSAEGCAIRLRDVRLAPRHVRLLPLDGGLVQVLSESSEEAVFVDGVPLMLRDVVAPGGTIGLGEVELRVVSS